MGVWFWGTGRSSGGVLGVRVLRPRGDVGDVIDVFVDARHEFADKVVPVVLLGKLLESRLRGRLGEEIALSRSAPVDEVLFTGR
nr:hypothetical protein CFP56_12277 [Quercus suber]